MSSSYRIPGKNLGIISPAEFAPFPDHDQVKIIVHWFHSRYRDPAHDTPYNSQEGGYQYVRGGPYDASEELYNEFGAFASDDVIRAAVEEIQSDGIFEWAPTAIHPDHIAFERSLPDRIRDVEKALADNDEPEPLPSLEAIRGRLAETGKSSFGDLEEKRRRRLLQTKIAELHELLAVQTPQHGGLGHNRPPDEMALSDDFTAEITQALETETAELQKDTPELAEVVKAAGIFQRLLSWAAEKVNLTLDAFLKALASAGGVALAGKLALGDLQPIWLKLAQVYRTTLEWLSTVTPPF